VSRPPLNYTTTVSVKQTVGECHDLLARAGADMVSTHLRDRKPVGLAFRLVTAGAPREFLMPVNIDGVHKLLQAATYPSATQAQGPKRLAQLASRDNAERVAWRIIKDWLEAQLALIASSMATLDQVMLPYMQVESGSLYELVQEQGRLAALEG
jgi:hypothetical protein